METQYILISSCILVPVSVSFFVLNVTFLRWDSGVENQGYSREISPTRWMLAVIIPLVVGVASIRKRYATFSGACAAGVLGFTVTLSSFAFLAALFSFAFAGSLATKVGKHKKKKFEEGYTEGGERNWMQVLANGMVAVEMSIVYMLETGCRDLPVDFSRHYTASWLSMAILGAICCSSGDTLSSELGSVFGGEPRLIHSWKKVPKGTNGGVTAAGLFFAAVGGALVGFTYYVTLLLVLASQQLHSAPPQWPLVLVGAGAGLLGSCIDSYLGATLQYSGVDDRTGFIVEIPSKHCKHISGRQVLDNHGVNLLASVITAFATPRLAFHIWKLVI